MAKMMHVPATDGQLVALKALLLGYAAAGTPSRRQAVLQMADAALAHLSSVDKDNDSLRVAFYHLLRAEVLRHGGDPLKDRNAAQVIAYDRRSDVFKQFMKLQDLEIGDPLLYSEPQNMRFVEDMALAAFTLNRHFLKDYELEFLMSVRLLDILNAHGVPFSRLTLSS